MTDIYLIDVSVFSDESVFKKYFNLCPEYRKKKTDSLRTESDRILSLGAEMLLAYGMSCRGAFPYKIATAPGGKPFAEDHRNIKFNLSHSGKYAAAAFSDTEIGIDIETPRTIELKIAERRFSDGERKFLESSKNKELEFLKIWTRKEALLKAAGTGLSAPLADICVLEDEVSFQDKIYNITTLCCDKYILSVARLGSYSSGPKQDVTFDIHVLTDAMLKKQIFKSLSVAK